MDMIVIYGNIYTRKKYERVDKFKNRVNNEFREILKSELELFKPEFDTYNVCILKHPIKDMNGHNVLTYIVNKKSKMPPKYKFMVLKIKLEW